MATQPLSTQQIQALVNAAAAQYNVPANVLQSIAKTESNYNPNAVSSAGAQGVMQLMPATATALGVTDPFDPTQNINGGAQLLSQLLTQYNGNVTLAVAAYNAGPTAVNNAGGVPNYPETQAYVANVLAGAGISPDSSPLPSLPTTDTTIYTGTDVLVADATGLSLDPLTLVIAGAIGLGLLLLAD
jgi:soluble lytic murein transglycosylase-like protein